MSIEELYFSFKLCKREEPSSVHELLDFIQLQYLKGELSPAQYRTLLLDLHMQGALKPEYFIEEIRPKSLIN